MSDRRPLVLVTGANRGIGLELVRRFAEDGARVIATCRDLASAERFDEHVGCSLAELAASHDVSVRALDLADGAGIDAFAASLRDEPIDLLLNNAGTMGPLPLEEHIHRQRFGGIDYDLWASILLTNTLGTVRLTEALADNVAASERKLIVTLSSTAGSIGDSDRGAMAYTTSKAALNKAMTIVARALAPKEVIVAIVCPGHVMTRLGIGGATLTIEDSVSGMLELFDSFTLADSGTFRRYNGETIGW
jgi:NAD(P)-dependent dehydrogenase (short-subunit alcohol dehydrogenase family)